MKSIGQKRSVYNFTSWLYYPIMIAVSDNHQLSFLLPNPLTFSSIRVCVFLCKETSFGVYSYNLNLNLF